MNPCEVSFVVPVKNDAVRLARCLARIASNVNDSKTCEIVVADDGRGMASEAVQRAFDPFYSGREAGRGVGMGLPKAWRLVDSNGGTVVLESRPGHGTRVSILLPLDAAPSGETNVSEANSSG